MNQIISHCHETKKCHSCDHELEQNFYCFFCEKIQEIKGKLDYFSIFGLETSFNIDVNKIEEAFDLLILVLHPDYYAQSSDADKSLALEYSTLLNSAKATLTHPLQRAKYLFSLLSPLTDQTATTPSASFIMEMFDMQEELDLAEEKGEIPEPLQTEIEKLSTNTEHDLDRFFTKLAAHPEDKALIPILQEEVSKFKFIHNLQERCLKIEEQSTNL